MNAPPLLRSAAKTAGALRGKGRSCPCCCDYGSTKTGPRNRAVARRAQRRVERAAWRAEVAS